MLKRILPILLILNLFLTAATVSQTSELQISRMEINIWPEYDQPSVLVIFRITFSSLTSFPARVNLRIPASAGNPYSVSMKDLDGFLYDLEYNVIPDGAWNRIEFVTSSQELQIEFYQPYVQQTDAIRAYLFHWITDYSIESLHINIQKPKYSTIMTTDPNLGNGTENPDDGLTYFNNDLSGLPAESIVDFQFTYIKTNDGLSASIMPVKAVDTALPQKNSWRVAREVLRSAWENQSLKIAIVLLFGGMIFFLLAATLISFRKTTWPEGDDRPEKKREKKKLPPVKNESSSIFCHHCGKQAKPGDVFCRVCGSEIRRD